jgi:hypothetical protein
VVYVLSAANQLNQIIHGIWITNLPLLPPIPGLSIIKS